MDAVSNTSLAGNYVQRNQNAARLGNGNASQYRAGSRIERVADSLAEHMQANAPVAVGQAVQLQNLRKQKFCQAISVLLQHRFISAHDKLVVLDQFDVALTSCSEIAFFNLATRVHSVDLLPVPSKLIANIKLISRNRPVPQNQIARQLLARLVDHLIEPVSRRLAQGLDIDAQDIKKTASTALALLSMLNTAASDFSLITRTDLDTEQLIQVCQILDAVGQFSPPQDQMAAQAAKILSYLKEKINYMNTDWEVFAEAPPNFLSDYDVMMAAVLQNGALLESASRVLRNDRALVFAAVRNDSMALKFAAEWLQSDRELVLAAVTGDTASEEVFGNISHALQFANTALRDDTDLVLAAVRNNGSALEVASNRLRDHRDVVMAAVKQDGSALEFASPRLQDDDDVVMAAIDNDPFALEFADNRLRNHPDFWYAAALM